MINSHDLPVVVGLSGGLGNQMFQYAAGRSLSERMQVPLVLDLSWFDGQNKRQFALSNFNIQASVRTSYSWMGSNVRALVSRISRRWFPKKMGVTVFREPHFHFAKNFDLLKKPVFLEGYWQSELYFKDHRSIIAQEFSLRETMPVNALELLHEILDCDSICVHVRRGDYLTDPIAAKIYESCTIQYYIDGVNEISKKLTNPRCFIFSDDPVWVSNFLNFDLPMKFVDINGPDDAHLDLALMAACKHFVIANSSLSWWGAWLGNDPSKKVIAPKRWFLGNEKNTSDLIPSSWMQL
jgi:Glycosyl transferase family 11